MFILILLSAIVGILRPLPLILFGPEPEPSDIPFGNKHYQQSYQAVAHILVGIWGTLWYFGVSPAIEVFIVLGCVELVCAFITFHLKRVQYSNENR